MGGARNLNVTPHGVVEAPCTRGRSIG